MFGTEKIEKPEEETFDLEIQIKNPAEYKKLKAHVERKVQELKQVLRSGAGDKEEFDQFGALLHAYAALLKLIVRLGEAK